MDEKLLECQGLPCPQPVLKAKRCLEADAPARIVVLVDNDPARENVSRFLTGKGYTISAERRGNDWAVVGVAAQDDAATSVEQECPVCQVMTDEELQSFSARTVVFITSSSLGVGDDELGSKLMLNFLSTLPELGSSLWRLVLVNGGVKLACDGNPCLGKIQELAAAGVGVLVCGTCLDHFDLLAQKKIGETTNMLDVVTSLQLATKVINV
ncbi:selenium metabolism protein YedF [Paucidesulfovibrio gracilis DSM 16080]|uniref:Selenium metabolism protein YedF n=1 Tax=Paucidesulfovibrio gracilis DSM 16080 TaxID=1121449 RepID=A0A1T4WPT3_9BACT|nr:sulfurtransferase-like selenium metabolism protein YedF [Paucidesulfovibrio gracilis]SKA78868.1 selenium metabolism protein YedF [Paucidesulfovibrio gracilis DSM 16080]